MSSPLKKTKALCVATRCTSIDDFVATYRRFCDETSFFVATLSTRPVGLDTPFSIQLADNTPALRGLCTVVGAWTTPANEFKRPGIRLGIKRLTSDSQVVFDRILAARGSQATMEPLARPSAAAVLVEPPEVVDNELTTPTPRPDPPRPPPIPPFVRARLGSQPVEAVPPPEVAAEARTPGSPIVLPANPLMNLSDESLEGFIDCTLYEQTANFFRAEDDADAPLVDEPAEPPPPTFLIPPRASSPVIEAPAPVPVELTPLPLPEPPAVLVSPSLQLHIEPPPAEPPPAEPLAMAPVAFYPTDEAQPAWYPEPARPRWGIIIGSAAVAVAAVFAIAAWSRSSSSSASVPPPPPPAPRVVAMPASPPPPPAPAPVAALAPAAAPVDEAKDEAEPPPSSGPPSVGSGPCRMTISTTPAGSTVKVDDQILGPSPIEVRTACAHRRVEVSHPRYQTVTRTVALAADHAEALDISLPRPIHAVTVVTVPPGATLSIDGHRAGTTPTIVQLAGFATTTLTIEKRGFPTITKRIYSKLPQDRVTVRLGP